MTAFDLTTTQTAPLGVEFVGKASNNTAGYTVTDVGNVTGSGYDSFVISATGLPGESINIGGKPLTFTAADESAVFLVFGSKAVNINTVSSYLNLTDGTTNGITTTLTGGQRAGDLGELGTLGVAAQSEITSPTAQTNPTVAQPQPSQASTHVYGFNFDGLTFVTGLDTLSGLGRNSALGYSVTALGDVNNDGFDDFALSAPNDSGGGKVFVIYGGTALATQSVANKTVDLEPTVGVTTTTAPTKVVSFSLSTGTTGTDVGFSVAGIGNYFGNGSSTHDLAIGAPGLTVGTLANAGAVFTVSGTYLNTLATGTNVDLATIGNGSNTVGGIEYTGYVAGGEVGYSVSTAGNFDDTTGTNGSSLDDLLIGAPDAAAGGIAYLVYGKQAYLPNQQIGTTQSLATLGVAPVTTPTQTFPLQGVVFGDTTSGDELGFSVSTAGDFNDDGVDDIMIGAPGYLTNTGYVEVIDGLAGTSTTTTSTRLNGIFTVSPVATNAAYTSVSFVGEGINDYTGYTIASSGHIQIGTSASAEPAFDILIGAPGLQTAYLVPGTGVGVTALTGTQLLSTINTTLDGNEFVVSGLTDPSVSNVGFGRSVSARNLVVDPDTGTNTVDPDSVPDLFFGAPFSSLADPTNALTVERSIAGVAYVVEGGLIGGSSSGGGTSGGTTTSTGVVTSFNTLINTLSPLVFTGTDAGLAFPPVSELSHLTSYQPLPVQLAYEQYLDAPGFLARQQVSLHPSQKGGSHTAAAGTVLNVAAIKGSENKYSKVNTLDKQVRLRGKFKVGKKTTYTHKEKVIPASQQTESFPG